MLSPYIHAALAHELHQEFLARAETDGGPGRRACTGCEMAQAPPADRRGAGALPGYGPARAACSVTGRGPR
jgi:hypothetical protein